MKLVFAALLLIGCLPLGMAQGTYTQIDVPGAITTEVYAIDAAGDLIGTYFDNNGEHGFLLSAGEYTTINYPGAAATALFGLNNLGEFVGFASDPQHGFLYNSQTQTFTTIGYPSAINTYPTTINDSGLIGGWFEGEGGSFGFVLAGSTYRFVAPKGASNSTVSGISSSGLVVGYVYFHTGLDQSFFFGHGDFRRLTVPNAPDAVVVGISPNGGTLVGTYQPSPGVYAGFVYQQGTLQSLQFAGSTETIAYTVNNSGEVAGTYYDASNTAHGFTWIPSEANGKKK